MSRFDGWYKVPVLAQQPECCGAWELVTCSMCGREAFMPPKLLIVDEEGAALLGRGPGSRTLCTGCQN